MLLVKPAIPIEDQPGKQAIPRLRYVAGGTKFLMMDPDND